MLDSIEGATRLIEGDEATFYMTSTGDWFGRYSMGRSTFRDSYCAAENKASYDTHVQCGKAVFSQHINGNQEWEHNVYAGMMTTDEYVWAFSPGVPWLAGGAPEGVRNAVQSAMDKYNSGQRLGFDMADNNFSSAVNVAITQPKDGTEYASNASVKIIATAPEGAISAAVLYKNALAESEDPAAPYEWSLDGLPDGEYTLVVRARNSSGAWGSSNPVIITIGSRASGQDTVFASVRITPQRAVVAPGGKYPFTSAALDPFGAPLSTQPSFHWSVSGGGSVDETGLFVAGGDADGTYELIATATVGGVSLSDTAAVTVADILCEDSFDTPVLAPQWTRVDTDNWTGGAIGTGEGRLIIEGRGAEFWGERYEYVGIWRDDLSGDFDVSVKVESQTDVYEWARAGIAASNEHTDFSKGGFCIVAVTPGNGFSFQADLGGSIGTLDNYTNHGSVTYPCQLRLKKEGAAFSAYYKTALLEDWVQIGTALSSQSTATNSSVGLFSSGVNADATCVAEFDDFGCSSDRNAVSAQFTHVPPRLSRSVVMITQNNSAIVAANMGGTPLGLTIVDAQGRIVYRRWKENNGGSVAAAHLKPGVYMAAVECGTGAYRTAITVLR
jgi:hypothetical protein